MQYLVYNYVLPCYYLKERNSPCIAKGTFTPVTQNTDRRICLRVTISWCRYSPGTNFLKNEEVVCISQPKVINIGIDFMSENMLIGRKHLLRFSLF